MQKKGVFEFSLYLSSKSNSDIVNNATIFPNTNVMYSNYRPISLLSVFSKVLEKVAYDRLYHYLVKFEILYAYHLDLRKLNSLTWPSYLKSKVVKALKNGLFIEFRKSICTKYPLLKYRNISNDLCILYCYCGWHEQSAPAPCTCTVFSETNRYGGI